MYKNVKKKKMKKLLFTALIAGSLFACNNATTEATDNTADSANNKIEATTDAAQAQVQDAADSAKKSLEATSDSAKDQIKAVDSTVKAHN